MLSTRCVLACAAAVFVCLTAAVSAQPQEGRIASSSLAIVTPSIPTTASNVPQLAMLGTVTLFSAAALTYLRRRPR